MCLSGFVCAIAAPGITSAMTMANDLSAAMPRVMDIPPAGRPLSSTARAAVNTLSDGARIERGSADLPRARLREEDRDHRDDARGAHARHRPASAPKRRQRADRKTPQREYDLVHAGESCDQIGR